VLDFGCGAGRVLRHFLNEADVGELHGCDIDEPSIRWLEENLSPPLHAFVNGESPPLPRPDGYFDLIWAASVFTHITDEWAEWLLEMHRLLADDGLLISSFLGCDMSQDIAAEPWDEDRIGMNILNYGNPWDHGGPNVLHSPWWIRAHWGRAFEVVDLHEKGFATPSVHGPNHRQSVSHGCVLLRKRNVEVTPEDLRRPEPDEPREDAAIRHNVDQLHNETARLYQHVTAIGAQVTGLQDALAASEERVETLQTKLAELRESRSWRLTRPLRNAAKVLGRDR
jgi:SAM-dependent methyltransferase